MFSFLYSRHSDLQLFLFYFFNWLVEITAYDDSSAFEIHLICRNGISIELYVKYVTNGFFSLIYGNTKRNLSRRNSTRNVQRNSLIEILRRVGVSRNNVRNIYCDVTLTRSFMRVIYWPVREKLVMVNWERRPSRTKLQSVSRSFVDFVLLDFCFSLHANDKLAKG